MSLWVKNIIKNKTSMDNLFFFSESNINISGCPPPPLPLNTWGWVRRDVGTWVGAHMDEVLMGRTWGQGNWG